MDVLTQAYVNMLSRLGGLTLLCRSDPEAGQLAQREASLSIRVSDGPRGTLRFGAGTCSFSPDLSGEIKLFYPSAAQFNTLFEGKAPPLPYSGVGQRAWLKEVFAPLLQRLIDCEQDDLCPAEEGQADPLRIELALHRLIFTLPIVAERDDIARRIAVNMDDGQVSIDIAGEVWATLQVSGGQLSARSGQADQPRLSLHIVDHHTAGGLLSYGLAPLDAIAQGRLIVSGYYPLGQGVERLRQYCAEYTDQGGRC